MKPKTLVLMGVAIACGLGASYMTARLLAERNTGDDPKVDVLVAKKPLNYGDTIKAPEEMFQVKRFTKDDAPVGAITDMAELKNRVLKRQLRVGDHVTPEELLSDHDDGGGTMPIVLPAGYRAVGVRVNLESGASGWNTLPLARVDIISTVRRADDRSTYAQVLLEDVLVLAADDKMRREETGKPMPSTIVTLALKPEDALKVRLAGDLGSLSLMLRKINDKSHVQSAKLTALQLKQGILVPQEDVMETAKAETTIPLSAPKEPAPKEPAPKEAAPPVAETPEKEVFTKHVVAISEGGRTRYFEYFFNALGEPVPESEAQPPAPPRPGMPLAPNDRK